MAAKLRIAQPDEPNEPIDRYVQEVEAGTLNPFPYERLMIWYRKQKMYQEELKTIEKGINNLKKAYADQQKQALGGKIKPSIKALSNKISKSMGLHDKKGNNIYLPEPIPKWLKRKQVVEGKMKPKKTAAKKKTKKR